MKKSVFGAVTATAALGLFGALMLSAAAYADSPTPVAHAAFAAHPLASAHPLVKSGAVRAQLTSYLSVAALAAAFADPNTGPVISLSNDLTGTTGDPAVAVRAGASITLDLNGHTLRLNTSSGPGLGVPDGTSLTIIDSVGGGALFVNTDGDGAGIGGAATANPTHNPAYGTIVISGAKVTATSTGGAGIGSGYQGGDGGGSVTIGDKSTVTATSKAAAGIGGAYYSGGSGPITIDGSSTVVATGGTFAVGGAGIGSGPNGFSDQISISGGSSVTATGGVGGAGIGGGSSGFALAITISGSTVHATGHGAAAGIGGGESGLGGPVTINGGLVTAVGGTGAGIGAGAGQGGYDAGSLTINANSDVTASAVSGIAFGAAPGASKPGRLTNNGILRIPAGNGITIPASSVAKNSGTIVLDGSITNQGTILNTGTIQNPQNVSIHNTTVSLNGNGGSVSAAQVGPVFASSFNAGQIPFPSAARPGYTFIGWYTAVTGGTQVTGATDLGIGGPKRLAIFARWSAIPYTVSFDSQGGSNVAPETVNYGDQAVPPTPPIRAGHTFIGWFADAVGGNQWKFTTPITANLTLYAQWSLSAQAGGPGAPGASTGGSNDGNVSGVSPSSKPGGMALANTGSNLDAWPTISLASLLLAAGLMIIARRRNRRTLGK